MSPSNFLITYGFILIAIGLIGAFWPYFSFGLAIIVALPWYIKVIFGGLLIMFIAIFLRQYE